MHPYTLESVAGIVMKLRTKRSDLQNDMGQRSDKNGGHLAPSPNFEVSCYLCWIDFLNVLLLEKNLT